VSTALRSSSDQIDQRPARSPKNPEKTQTDDDGEAGEDAEMKMGVSTHTKTRETLEIAQGVRV